MRLFALVSVLALVSSTAGAQLLPDERAWRESVAHYQAGQELLASERWQKAAEEFQRAIKLNRYFSDAYYGLGVAYMGMRRYTSAALAFQDFSSPPAQFTSSASASASNSTG